MKPANAYVIKNEEGKYWSGGWNEKATWVDYVGKVPLNCVFQKLSDVQGIFTDESVEGIDIFNELYE